MSFLSKVCMTAVLVPLGTPARQGTLVLKVNGKEKPAR